MGVKLRDRDPIYLCWRIAAIYRCVLRYGCDRDWALARVREAAPDGRRDHMVDIWFLGLENFRERAAPQAAREPVQEIWLAA